MISRMLRFIAHSNGAHLQVRTCDFPTYISCYSLFVFIDHFPWFRCCILDFFKLFYLLWFCKDWLVYRLYLLKQLPRLFFSLRPHHHSSLVLFENLQSDALSTQYENGDFHKRCLKWRSLKMQICRSLVGGKNAQIARLFMRFGLPYTRKDRRRMFSRTTTCGFTYSICWLSIPKNNLSGPNMWLVCCKTMLKLCLMLEQNSIYL